MMWQALIKPPRLDYSLNQICAKKEIMENETTIVNRFCFKLPHQGYELACTLLVPLDCQEDMESSDLALARSSSSPEPEYLTKNNVKEAIPKSADLTSCIVYLHSHTGSQLEGKYLMELLLTQKFSLLLFDFGGSGRSTGQYVTLGRAEKEQAKTVIRFLRKEIGYQKIGAWGKSMGAVTALFVASDAAKNIEAKHCDYWIDAMVLDSPFDRLKDVIFNIFNQHSNFPSLIVQGAMRILRSTVLEKANFDVFKVNPIEEMDSIYLPALFVSGHQDEIVKLENFAQLYEKYKGNKKMYKVSGGHSDIRTEDPVFRREVIDFFKAELLATNLKENLGNQHQQQSQKQNQLSQPPQQVVSKQPQQQLQNFYSSQFQPKKRQQGGPQDLENSSVRNMMREPISRRGQSICLNNNPNNPTNSSIQETFRSLSLNQYQYSSSRNQASVIAANLNQPQQRLQKESLKAYEEDSVTKLRRQSLSSSRIIDTLDRFSQCHKRNHSMDRRLTNIPRQDQSVFTKSSKGIPLNNLKLDNLRKLGLDHIDEAGEFTPNPREIQQVQTERIKSSENNWKQASVNQNDPFVQAVNKESLAGVMNPQTTSFTSRHNMSLMIERPRMDRRAKISLNNEEQRRIANRNVLKESFQRVNIVEGSGMGVGGPMLRTVSLKAEMGGGALGALKGGLKTKDIRQLMQKLSTSTLKPKNPIMDKMDARLPQKHIDEYSAVPGAGRMSRGSKHQAESVSKSQKKVFKENSVLQHKFKKSERKSSPDFTTFSKHFKNGREAKKSKTRKNRPNPLMQAPAKVKGILQGTRRSRSKDYSIKNFHLAKSNDYSTNKRDSTFDGSRNRSSHRRYRNTMDSRASRNYEAYAFAAGLRTATLQPKGQESREDYDPFLKQRERLSVVDEIRPGTSKPSKGKARLSLINSSQEGSKFHMRQGKFGKSCKNSKTNKEEKNEQIRSKYRHFLDKIGRLKSKEVDELSMMRGSLARVVESSSNHKKTQKSVEKVKESFGGEYGVNGGGAVGEGLWRVGQAEKVAGKAKERKRNVRTSVLDKKINKDKNLKKRGQMFNKVFKNYKDNLSKVLDSRLSYEASNTKPKTTKNSHKKKTDFLWFRPNKNSVGDIKKSLVFDKENKYKSSSGKKSTKFNFQLKKKSEKKAEKRDIEKTKYHSNRRLEDKGSDLITFNRNLFEKETRDKKYQQSGISSKERLTKIRSSLEPARKAYPQAGDPMKTSGVQESKKRNILNERRLFNHIEYQKPILCSPPFESRTKGMSSTVKSFKHNEDKGDRPRPTVNKFKSNRHKEEQDSAKNPLLKELPKKFNFDISLGSKAAIDHYKAKKNPGGIGGGPGGENLAPQYPRTSGNYGGLGGASNGAVSQINAPEVANSAGKSKQSNGGYLNVIGVKKIEVGSAVFNKASSMFEANMNRSIDFRYAQNVANSGILQNRAAQQPPNQVVGPNYRSSKLGPGRLYRERDGSCSAKINHNVTSSGYGRELGLTNFGNNNNFNFSMNHSISQSGSLLKTAENRQNRNVLTKNASTFSHIPKVGTLNQESSGENHRLGAAQMIPGGPSHPGSGLLMRNQTTNNPPGNFDGINMSILGGGYGGLPAGGNTSQIDARNPGGGRLPRVATVNPSNCQTRDKSGMPNHYYARGDGGNSRSNSYFRGSQVLRRNHRAGSRDNNINLSINNSVLYSKLKNERLLCSTEPSIDDKGMSLDLGVANQQRQKNGYMRLGSRKSSLNRNDTRNPRLKSQQGSTQSYKQGRGGYSQAAAQKGVYYQTGGGRRRQKRERDGLFSSKENKFSHRPPHQPKKGSVNMKAGVRGSNYSGLGAHSKLRQYLAGRKFK